jgi:hypothetical protein
VGGFSEAATRPDVALIVTGDAELAKIKGLSCGVRLLAAG